MQNPPQLLPTSLQGSEAPGVRYAISGELVPVLHVWLDGSTPVFFEHHVVLWKEPNLDIRMHPLKGGFKRMVAGMPIFMTEAQGPGEIAFSRDGAAQGVGSAPAQCSNPSSWPVRAARCFDC